MNQAEKLPDPNTTPLAQFDLSDPRLYEQDAWRPYFARLWKTRSITSQIAPSVHSGR